MGRLRQYAVATTEYFPLVTVDDTDFETTPPTFVAGDSQISKDGGAFANTTNLPSHVGNGIYEIDLTATELQAATVVVTIKDTLIEDQSFDIDTFGSVAGRMAFNFNDSSFKANINEVAGVGVTGIADFHDWTSGERENIRDAIGVTGTKTAATGGQLQDMQGATFSSATDSLEAIRDRGDAAWTTATGFSTHTAADAADAVWDETTAGHTTAGTFGEQCATDIDAILVDTNSLNDTKVPDTISLANINAEVDTALSDYDAPTKTELDAGFAALNDIAIADVQTAITNEEPIDANITQVTTTAVTDVNDFKADVSTLATSTIQTLQTKIARNRVVISSGTITVYDDDNTTPLLTGTTTAPDGERSRVD